MDLPKGSGVVFHTLIVVHQHGGATQVTVFPNGSPSDIGIPDARQQGADLAFTIPGWGWSFRVRPEGPNLRVALSFDGWKTEESHLAVPASPAETGLPALLPPPALRELPANGLAWTPPMGWNSWNHFEEAVDDRVVRETADAMVSSGMAAAGYST